MVSKYLSLVNVLVQLESSVSSSHSKILSLYLGYRYQQALPIDPLCYTTAKFHGFEPLDLCAMGHNFHKIIKTQFKATYPSLNNEWDS